MRFLQVTPNISLFPEPRPVILNDPKVTGGEAAWRQVRDDRVFGGKGRR